MWKRSTGMTLIELMVVVSIVGILGAIAYPLFVEQAAKARRAQARALIYEVLEHEERFYTENNRYTTDLTALGFAALLHTDQNTHSIALAVGPTGNLATSVQITGTAVVPDSKCATLTLTSAHAQSGTGSDPTLCW
jgi:type IV pilus assembly protein PilE